MGELALDKVKKFFDAVYWFFMTICKIGFIGMVGITTYVIINRYFIKSACTWGEPVVLMFMVYMSLISAALAIRKDTHIRMQIVDLFVPKKVICVMRGAAQVLIFFFGVFMIIYGIKFSKLAGRNIMTGVGIKSMWLYISVPIAGVAMCLMEIERFINFCDRVRRGVTLEGGTIEDDAKAMAEEAAEQGSEISDALKKT